jgi:hypothetical protein
MRDDADALCDASRELLRKTESLVDIVLRVQAEAYELGGRKMPPWNWWLRGDGGVGPSQSHLRSWLAPTRSDPLLVLSTGGRGDKELGTAPPIVLSTGGQMDRKETLEGADCFVNETELSPADAAALPRHRGRDPGRNDDAQPEPVGAQPRSEITGRHNAGSGANETIDGLTSSEEAIRGGAEDTPIGIPDRYSIEPMLSPRCSL